jgi:septum formation protein
VIYLASRSPQRAMLLARAHVDATVVPSSCREDDIRHAQPQVLALERARAKAAGAQLTPAQLALCPVVIGNLILGTPTDRADAKRILAQLSGTTHAVVTGHACAVFAPDGSVQTQAARLATARVTMRPLTEEEIDAYVNSGESDGRAGAYAIQEHGDRFVTELEGSWDTVVGLNLAIVARLYRECTDHPLPGYTP